MKSIKDIAHFGLKIKAFLKDNKRQPELGLFKGFLMLNEFYFFLTNIT
jgi:hypothetical protein